MKDNSRSFLLLGALIVYAVCLSLGGGSSRSDALLVLIVRLAAIVLIATALLISEEGQLDRIRMPLFFLSVVILILALQLVPLPQMIWGSLPGRDLYVDLGRLIGDDAIWRPLSISPDLTLNSALAVLPPAAVVVAMGVVDNHVRRHFVIAILVIVLVSVLMAVLQQSDGPNSALRFYRPTNPDFGVGLFANRNHQALLMAIGIPLVSWWVFKRSRRFRNMPLKLAMGTALCAACLVGAALTASRTGLFLTFVGLLGAILIAWPTLIQLSRRLQLALSVGFLVIASVSFLLVFPSLARFSSSAVATDGRLSTLPEVMSMLRTFFPVGVGFGAFERVYSSFEPVSALSPQYLNHVHNDLIELGIEAGVFGYVLLVAVVGWWLCAGVRAWRDDIAYPQVADARLGTVIIALCFLASITDYPLRTPIIASVFAVATMLLHFGASRPGPVAVALPGTASPPDD